MKIWQLYFDVENYDNLMPIKSFTADEIQSFNGTPRKDNWSPLSVKRMEPERQLPLSDAPGFTIPVFSKNAVELLCPLISNSAEVLPLDFTEKEYYGINVLSILDVIDYTKSKYRLFSDGKRIMAFQKYSFRECEELEKYHIFKIIDEPTRRAFVSDEFKQTVENSNLTGFIFKLIWDNAQE
ncbi:MAG: hypothetical protein IJN11_01595 [Oscillospiraceae bacterium]|nr:hypothetical protein [Oscillospiraceae bacterium]MBQ7012596.1 hypothetical protein [Oscillospiraceae bacterium]